MILFVLIITVALALWVGASVLLAGFLGRMFRRSDVRHSDSYEGDQHG